VPEEVIYVRKKLQAVEGDIDREFKESVWVKLNLKGNDKLLFGCVYKSLSSNEANLTALNGLISKVCDMNCMVINHLMKKIVSYTFYKAQT
jgi:hypothetical protein